MTAANADRVVAAFEALQAHPPQLPWTLECADAAGDPDTLLKATTAVLLAFARTHENKGSPLPPGGVAELLRTALDAWELDGSDQVRMEAAYAVTLAALS